MLVVSGTEARMRACLPLAWGIDSLSVPETEWCSVTLLFNNLRHLVPSKLIAHSSAVRYNGPMKHKLCKKCRALETERVTRWRARQKAEARRLWRIKNPELLVRPGPGMPGGPALEGRKEGLPKISLDGKSRVRYKSNAIRPERPASPKVRRSPVRRSGSRKIP
jgi:hypothetical protein